MFKIGDKVTYMPKKEKGIVKSIAYDNYVFVVFHCDNKWEYYYNYTGALTDINDLIMGWDLL